ncbi:hypothetical protein IEQ34_003989 [Dendrobium chrysotoxum]|uniref:Uncharacterized protein n=1 Tax=Dendrobium chrysotoxum TaxID=161865 RepID=A0AAV7HCV6_DENCH|nr:hypothetical protein IEQ34_003989 [Dendrobium chrysotoxum]
MAASVGAARRALLHCSTSSRGSLRRSASLPACAAARVTRRVLPSSTSRDCGLFVCRLPVELCILQSLMPFHSATASALLTSKLSLKPGSWAWLSEGASLSLSLYLSWQNWFDYK